MQCWAPFYFENIMIRNVADKYREWATDLIREDLKKNSFPYAVLMEHLTGDFNFSQCIRNANVFGAHEVFYLGKKKFDPRGAVGSQFYSQVTFLPSHDELIKLKDKYTFIGLDNIEGSVAMEDFDWPDHTLMVMGEEHSGLSPEMIALCDKIVAIKQFGSVRSLNAGTACGIACYDFTNKFMRKNK